MLVSTMPATHPYCILHREKVKIDILEPLSRTFCAPVCLQRKVPSKLPHLYVTCPIPLTRLHRKLGISLDGTLARDLCGACGG